jgi:hypothetical protein
MRRDAPHFAEQVQDKATLSTFFSGLPVSNHAVDESAADFIRQPVCHSRLWVSSLEG